MFNPLTRYLFHAEDLEESMMSYTHGDADSWEDALTEFLYTWDNNEAQKVLSELNLDTTEDGAVSRLRSHYARPEIRDQVIESWHSAGQYLPTNNEN